MQNWNDNTLSRMPGVRDRVVRVRLKDSEGGMNLNMDQAVIKAIADRGEEAARQLCEHYSPPQEGWDNQRWARFAVALTLLQQRSRGVVSALSPSVAHATPYADLVDQGMTKGLFGEKAPFTDPQRAALLAMIDALRQLDAAFNPTTSVYAFDPLPKPDLRIRPSL